MNRTLTIGIKGLGMRGLMAALLFVGAPWAQAQDAEPDDVLNGWLGKEFTVETASVVDSMPIGGKLTFIFDSAENVVRVCTRTSTTQRGPWRADFAIPCSVTMTFTRGTRFCTVDDVKTGNAEILSTCHRLRTRDVALRPSKVKGAVELNDLIAFLIKEDSGRMVMSILVDSPARVTEDGVIVVGTGHVKPK